MTDDRRASGKARQHQTLRRIVWWFIAGLVSSGCESRTCTDADCDDVLLLQLKAEDWVPGAYAVSFTESGRAFECAFEKGASGADGRAGRQSDDESSGTVGRCNQTAGEPATLRETPAMSGGEHGDITIVIYNAPERVPVSVRRDSVVVFEEELAPSYTQSHPNGPECGPTCLNATETLTL